MFLKKDRLYSHRQGPWPVDRRCGRLGRCVRSRRRSRHRRVPAALCEHGHEPRCPDAASNRHRRVADRRPRDGRHDARRSVRLAYLASGDDVGDGERPERVCGSSVSGVTNQGVITHEFVVLGEASKMCAAGAGTGWLRAALAGSPSLSREDATNCSATCPSRTPLGCTPPSPNPTESNPCSRPKVKPGFNFVWDAVSVGSRRAMTRWC